MRSLVVGAVLLIGLTIGTRAQNMASAGFPPPGRMIDIGGRKLHLYCTGKGSPTVILIPGGGAYSIDWALVQPKVAEHTRVCSYDRAGLGWSDPGPAEETVEETTSDLHSVLRTSEEKSPYLLVGASIAGIFIQAYQHTYPQDSCGLVFSNSSNRIGFQVKSKVGLIWDLTESEIRSAYPFPTSQKKGPAPTHEDDPFDRLSPEAQKVRLWLDLRLWEKSDPAKATPDSLLSWRKEFLRGFNTTDPGKKPPLGDLPVVVVSSAPAGLKRHANSAMALGPA